MVPLLPLTFAVAIAIEAPEPWTGEPALREACSTAIGEGRCRFVESFEPDDAITAHVATSDDDRVLVEVTVRSRAGSRSALRELLFRPEDAKGDRARSIGLTIALLARELGLPDEPATAPAATAPAEPPPVVERTAAPWSVGLDTELAWDSELDLGEPGFALHVERRVLGALFVGVRFGLRFADLTLGARGVNLTFMTPLLQVGYEVPLGSFALSPTVEVGPSLLHAALETSDAAEPGPPSSERGDRVSPVVVLGIPVQFPRAATWAVCLTPEVTFDLAPTELVVDGFRAAVTSPVLPGLRAGVVYRFGN